MLVLFLRFVCFILRTSIRIFFPLYLLFHNGRTQILTEISAYSSFFFTLVANILVFFKVFLILLRNSCLTFAMMVKRGTPRETNASTKLKVSYRHDSACFNFFTTYRTLLKRFQPLQYTVPAENMPTLDSC